ncbi:MAG: hypothetical protein NWS46_11080 [Cyclobacteriaceae bacterium]|jgi:uncharacterized membrane protein|nr:hypothetical protein [Cyclobacteriaceae bacterium]
MEASRIRSISLFLLIGFFTFAGINHFIVPDFYYPLIPPYLKYIVAINMLSGAVEILFGIGLVFKSTRKYSAYLIIVMLVAFIPSHIYFIQLGSCIPDGLCVPIWVGWMRLLLVHPLLILWVWSHRLR